MNLTHSAAFYGIADTVFPHACCTQKYTLHMLDSAKQENGDTQSIPARPLLSFQMLFHIHKALTFF